MEELAPEVNVKGRFKAWAGFCSGEGEMMLLEGSLSLPAFDLSLLVVSLEGPATVVPAEGDWPPVGK
jgi:hypothetical protein